MDLVRNIVVTSRQLHDAPSQRMVGVIKYYVNASNSVGQDKIVNNANVSSRRVPGGNANSMRVPSTPMRQWLGLEGAIISPAR